jgi:hypothetical protein
VKVQREQEEGPQPSISNTYVLVVIKEEKEERRRGLYTPLARRMFRWKRLPCGKKPGGIAVIVILF